MNEQKCVLITGAGGGLGRALSDIYANNGFRVFAGDIFQVAFIKKSLLTFFLL